MSPFTHPHVTPNPWDFRESSRHNDVLNILSLFFSIHLKVNVINIFKLWRIYKYLIYMNQAV